MPLLKLPIHEGIVKAVDEVGLVTHGAAMVDVYVDELDNINRRPGLVELCDLGTSAAVDGLFWWPSQSWVIAISAGNTYKITNSAGSFSQITHDDTDFAVGTRVTFADFKTSLFAANGGKIKEIPNSGNVSDMADADAPTTVSHVAFLDRYLLANEISSALFHYSAVGSPTVWAAEYAEAEAKKDDLLALGVEDLKIGLFGQKTTEFWYDDGTTPFIRETQGYVSRGTSAKYSPVWCDAQNTWAWLDQNRQAVMLNGVTPVPISLTLSKYIDTFTSVTDCIGDFVTIAGRPYLIFGFPAEDKTLVWDFNSARWYEWAYWSTSTATYSRFRGNSFCFSPAWNVTLAGDRANGKVYKFDTTNYDDDGDTLRAMVRTAHYNHGTESKRKFSNKLIFRLKRTSVVSDDATPDLMVKYRDNGSALWKNEHSVSLQQIGDTEFRGTISRLGSYYSRQYQITLSDAYPLCLVSMEEDVEIE